MTSSRCTSLVVVSFRLWRETPAEELPVNDTLTEQSQVLMVTATVLFECPQSCLVGVVL